MAVQFAKAFGMHVTVFSTSAHKEQEARQILGVDDFIVTKDENPMQVNNIHILTPHSSMALAMQGE